MVARMLGRVPRLAALVVLAACGCASTPGSLPPPGPPAPPGGGAPVRPPTVGGALAPPIVATSAPAPAMVAGTTAPALVPGVALDEHPLDDDPDDDDDEEAIPPIVPPAASSLVPARPPALTMDDAAFARTLKEDAASLGSMSIGRPNAGLLVNGVRMPEGRGWNAVDPDRTWGTRESVEALVRAIDRVEQRFPDTPPLSIGHISARRGGPLSPHKSHQAGRDADIGYYYSVKAPWFARATAQNLDRPRTWELVKAFDGDAEMILMDSSVQLLLRDWALAHGEDPALVDRLLQVGSHSPRPLVRHVHGHATHIHVRFTSPDARAVGARAEPFYRAELERIAARSAAPPPHPGRHGTRAKETSPAPADKKPVYLEHRVHDGDTLYRLAKHYGTSVEAIQKANGLKGFALKPRMVLRIPKG
jgi:penicillin-insensitive murein endopeptidase